MTLKTLFQIAAAPLALMAANPVHAQQAQSLDIPDVASPSVSQDTMRDVTRMLSSDEFEGRAPGSVGEQKTIALLTERFAKAGLKPGNGDSWLQKVPLVSIEAGKNSPLAITGGKTPLSFEYGKDMVIGTYREAEAIDIVDSDVVFVGYGINAPEKGWNDYAGIDVRGKTVIILVNDPDYDSPDLSGEFGGKAMTYYGRWTYKYEEAARQGAAAALIVHDTVPAAYGWGVVESSWTGPQFFAQSADKGASQTKANGWIQKEAAAKLLASAGQDLTTLSAAAKRKGFKPVPLGVKASVSFANAIETTISNNIIGILPGARRPDEYVLYTAHWDHLGRCKPAADGDDICNGAVDNATGTAALVALAETFAKAGAPDRSIVFLAVTAEESGLLGSAYYGQNPIYPLAQTVGGINMDAFMMAGRSKNVTVVGKGKSQLDDFLAAALTTEGRVAEADATPQNGYYYRSDHFSLAKQGVPMLYIDGGDDLVVGGKAAGQAAAKDYTVNRYHGPKDEFNPDWDWSGVIADLSLYYRVGRSLAMSQSWPNWVEGDEFRAIRDQSRAGQ
ncbi:M28 family metallopeptidase [Sphingomonas sp. 35-24ZXX]|uniref:M28 family metallopeptidase n=1 Tax=Sphingomonas sp. 35-24ZXX TaxID=1545915 RepID=UPI00053C06AF|nr:M28 family metallopeptidase [Sphingomonas sp. 35-24ZXX]